MRFLDWIIEELEDIADFFYDLYRETRDWPDWAGFVSDFFYGIYGRFKWLTRWFGDFNEWVEDTVDRLRDILDFGDIWSLFRTWFEWAEDAWYWVRYAFENVLDVITEWWPSILNIIKDYIAIAVEGLTDLLATWDEFWTVTFPSWTSKLDDLKATWDNFWVTIFPDLVSFTWLETWWNSRLLDIQSLIESWTLTLAPFWEGWQEIRDTVLEFFADPLKWLYDRLEDFMDRYW